MMRGGVRARYALHKLRVLPVQVAHVPQPQMLRRLLRERGSLEEHARALWKGVDRWMRLLVHVLQTAVRDVRRECEAAAPLVEPHVLRLIRHRVPALRRTRVPQRLGLVQVPADLREDGTFAVEELLLFVLVRWVGVRDGDLHDVLARFSVVGKELNGVLEKLLRPRAESGVSEVDVHALQPLASVERQRAAAPLVKSLHRCVASRVADAVDPRGTPHAGIV